MTTVDPRADAPRSPAAATPPAAPGAFRRTTHVAAGPAPGHDWGEGLDVPRSLHAAGRDLRLDGQGHGHPVGEARLTAELDAHLAIQRLTLDDTEVAEAIGLRAAPGFRGAIGPSLPDPNATSAAVLLDLGIGGNLSSYGRLQAARESGQSTSEAMHPGAVERMAGSCRGWASDGDLVAALRAGTTRPPQRPPAVPGPDREAWHDLGDLPPGWVRRRRRIDVEAPEPDGGRRILAAFRDSWCDPDGGERSLHEWELRLDLDADGTVVLAAATPRSLPFTACPQVRNETPDVAGAHVSDLRRRSRTVLGGEAGCTHLDDLLSTIPAAFAAATRT